MSANEGIPEAGGPRRRRDSLIMVKTYSRRDKAHRDAWALWRRHHQYGAQQAHQRWHAYADEVPQAG
jgi:hypothetical protein